jgi:hypothetical protein
VEVNSLVIYINANQNDCNEMEESNSFNSDLEHALTATYI